MKTRTAALVGGLVAAALMRAEAESPGATGRSAETLREAITPALAATVGAASDAILVARTEVGRQGISGVLTTPTTAGLGAINPDSPQGLPPQGGE